MKIENCIKEVLNVIDYVRMGFLNSVVSLLKSFHISGWSKIGKTTYFLAATLPLRSNQCSRIIAVTNYCKSILRSIIGVNVRGALGLVSTN
jgi:hypothetical protein